MSSRNNTSTSSYKWADLPKELLEIIGKHLESRIDVFRFRAVSPSWRSVVSSSYRQNQYSLTLPPTFSGAAYLSPATICRLEHRNGGAACLVKVVESISGELQLLSPLSSDPQIKQIPGNNFRKTLNLLDFRLIEIARGYHLNFTHTPASSTLKKVILFYNCGILALYDLGKLGFLEFGDDNWIILGDEGTCYDDVMVYKNQYYVIDSMGTIFWIDKTRNLVQYSIPLCGFGHLKNIIASDGQFYVVDSYLEKVAEGQAMFEGEEVEGQDYRCRRRRVDMKVYKLDEEWGTWVDVKSLGNRVFVLGKEVCFSVCVENFPGCQGNCIYFIDPRLEDRYDPRLEDRRAIGWSKRFVGRMFRFDTDSIKTVDCFPTYRRLFSLAMNWQLSAASSS